MSQYTEDSYDIKHAMGELENSLERIGGNFEKSTFGSYENCPNPKSSVSGGEVSGGTFSVDSGVHAALEGALETVIGNMEIEGGATEGGAKRSKESRALKSIERTGNDLKSQLSYVSGSVTKRIENIYNLQNVIDSGFNKLYDIIKRNEHSINSQDAKIISDVQNALKNEMQNQLKALQNILNVSIRPSTQSLIDLLKNNESFSALADTLGVGYNDADASDRLALVYTNLSHLGLVSKQVKDALSTLNITLEKYKNINNVEQLKNELSETLKRINNTKTTEQLNKIIKAMGVLENSQHRHSEVVECLKDEKKCSKQVSGGDELEGGDELFGAEEFFGADEFEGGDELFGADESTGGDYTKNVGRIERSRTKSTLVRRIKTYEKTLKELFKNFISQINLNFRDIQKDVQEVSDLLGNEIPYDDNIKLFISIFEGFVDDLENEKLFYALIGLDRSMASREVKIRFMDNLNRLIQSLEVLKNHKYLGDIKKQLMLTKENIDTYSDTVTNIKSSEEVKKGGDDFMWTDKLVAQSMPLNTAKIIRDTINKLKFYGSVSMIKANLSRMTKEHTEYKADYNQLLGKSIGIKLTELNREYTENIDRLHDKERGRGWVLDQYNNQAGLSQDEKVPRGLVETLYKLQYDSKVGLYKTIEAIDIYLMDFTEQLSGNIEATRELSQMLKQTEIISKWFDAKSGTNLDNLLNLITIDVKQTISEVTATELKVLPELSPASIVGGKNIKEILENSKRAIDSVAVLKNIISMFVHIGDKFGNKTLSKEMYMSPNIIYKNLIKYIWVSAFTMGYGTGGGDINANIDSIKKDKNVYEIEKGDKASFFDVKFTSLNTPLDTLKDYEDKLRADIKTKKQQLVAAIVTTPIIAIIGVLPIIANETELKAAVEAAKIAVGVNTILAYRTIVNTNLARVAAAAATPAAAGTAAAATILNVAKSTEVTVLAALATREYAVVRYYDLELLEKSIKNDIFTNEDKYFILSLKAITAKILTVIGSANLLKQPSSVSSMITNPIRTIIGGGLNPEVNDDAFELYIRLPLLVEFYKNIFENGNEQYKKNKYKSDETEIIAYIPEIGSIWSGLIQCIFDESRYIANGIYSVENMKKIIFEVNNIFKSYKTVEKAKLVRTVILDLVSEINRRYGILKRQEINEFYQIKKKYTKNMDDINVNNVNFDILDDSNEYEDAGPSSQYTENIFNKTSNSSKIIQTDINIVKAFRDKIHAELFSKGVELKDLSKKSFTEKIKFYKNELKNLQSNEPKIELIIKAIDESSNINSHNTDVNLMFHELVIAPLKNLQVLDNWMYSLFSNYIPEMYSSYHKVQIDNSENEAVINTLAAAAAAAPADLKSAISSAVYNPNLVTKFILQCCDTLNGVPTQNVAAALANATAANVAINELSKLAIECNNRPNNYTTAVAVIDGLGLPALLRALIRPGTTSNELTALINSMATKVNEFLVKHPSPPVPAPSPQQEFIQYHKLRSEAYKLVGSFVNIQPQLNDVIDVINTSYETIKLARVAEGVVDATVIPGAANRSLYQINQDNFVTSIDDKLVTGFNKVSLINFVSEMTFDGNNLLNMKFMSSNKFVLDYTKLQEYIEKSIESIKYMIAKFRNQLPKTMVSKYENCVFNIEDKLLFKILNNQDTTDVALFNVYNLDLVNNSFGEIINNTRQKNLNDDLYNSIMFNGTYNLNNTNTLATLPAGISDVLDANSLFGDIFKQYVPATRSWTRHDQVVAAAAAGVPAGINFLHLTNVYGNTNSKQTNILKNGLIYKFNTLVYQYLTVFYDSSTKKIYNNLFNEFATKSQSTCIFGNTGIADIFTRAAIAVAAPNNTFLNKFVQNDFVLCESLAIMFKTFINRTTNVQLPIKYHLQTMLSEVSPNMLEKYKTFLPVFITLFESLIQKALLYKKILDTTEDSKIAGTAAAVAIAAPFNVDQTINGDIVGEDQTYKGRWVNDAQNSQVHYNNTLVNLIDACRSLINDATVVLNEMNAKPQYFELKENFIKNFYNNANVLPLMPLSLNTIMLNNLLDEQSLLPNNVSPTFTNSNIKFLYGINSIINNKSLDNNINNYVWLKEAFNAYNSSALSVNKIEANKINEYLDINNKIAITLSKVLHYNRFLSKIVDIRRLAVPLSSVLANAPTLGNTKNEIINTYFTLPLKDIENAISITENSAIENSKMKISNEVIVNGLTKDSFNLNRSNARLLNIIDLNIIPINVHALMREIPLINIYNYAFTYDSVIKGEFGDVVKPSTKEEMLAKLLLDPYYISNELLTAAELGKPNAPLAGVPTIPLAGVAAKYVSTYDLIKQTVTEPFKDLGTAKFLTDMAKNSLFGPAPPAVPVAQDLINLRMDNKFTRNIMFLVNLQRVIMYKIKKEVERIDTKVVSDIGLLNPKITGYDNNPPAFDDKEFEYLEI